MFAYILKRILLMIPTLFGVLLTLWSYSLCPAALWSSTWPRPRRARAMAQRAPP